MSTPVAAPSAEAAESRPFPRAAGDEAFLRDIQEEIGITGNLQSDEGPAVSAAADALLRSDGKYGRNARWALMLLRSRQEIVDALDDLYGGEGGITLFTPALVDFSYWLDSDPLSPLEDQIHVMDLIQRRRTGRSMVHSFVAFDPWRQIASEEAGASPSPLELVEYAIMEAGFVGVKIYPPMGFLPSGNARSALSYPERAAGIPEFPKKLDSALEKLFAWCEGSGVPVMAHATNSNGANVRYGQRANPYNWATVLRKHPRLRLNLGHFGGFDEALGGGAPESTWEWAIGNMAHNLPEPVFADLSYLSEFLGKARDPDIRPRIRFLLKQYKEQFGPEIRNLMYGSDWIMLGREENHQAYPQIIERLLTDIGFGREELRRFFMTNAIEYLGLRSDHENRKRLERYYLRHNLDSSRLKVFDV